MEHLKLFKYEALDKAQNEIRLLKVVPCEEAGAISLQSCHVELSAHESLYDAISYTWGSDKADRVVLVDGKRFYVRENAYNFLRHRCAIKTDQRPFWMDAICINQDDLEEKSWQVAMMDRIFAGAEKVMVWLGRQSESDVLFSFFSRYLEAEYAMYGPLSVYYIYSWIRTAWSQRSYRLSSKSKQKELEDACMALKPAIEDLIRADYWERLWIVQEVILARSCLIIAGSGVLDFSDLVQALCRPELSSLFSTSKSRLIWSLRDDQFTKAGGRRIAKVVEHYKDQKCYDLRDRIYGLLGVSQDLISLSVNYRDSSEMLFAKAIQQIAINEPERTDLMRQDIHLIMQALQITSQSMSQALRSTEQEQNILIQRVIPIEITCQYVLEPLSCLRTSSSLCPNNTSRLLHPGDQHITLPSSSDDQPHCFMKRAPYAELKKEPLLQTSANRKLLCSISGIRGHFILTEDKQQVVRIQQCFNREWEKDPIPSKYLTQFKVKIRSVCTFSINASAADLVLLQECFEPADNSSGSYSDLLCVLLKT